MGLFLDMYTNWPTRKVDDKGRISLNFGLPEKLYGVMEHYQKHGVKILCLYSNEPVFSDPGPNDLESVLNSNYVYPLYVKGLHHRVILPKEFRGEIEKKVHYLLRPNSVTLVGILK